MSALSADDVLRQIDFELAQGLVGDPDLRAALRALQRFQGETRAAVLGDEARPIDLRDAFSRQLKINDLLISILAGAAEAAQDSRKDSLRVERLIRAAFAPESGLASEEEQGLATGELDDDGPVREELRAARHALSSPVAVEPDAVGLLDPPDVDRDETEIERAMQAKSLWLTMDPRSPRIPLAGSLFGRFRTALHTRVLIYVGQLAEKQGAVNRVFGDHLLRLRSVVRAQQEAIDVLRLRLRRLSQPKDRRDG